MGHKWDTDFASDTPEHAKRQGLAPATGPDTRQPDMVSRERVIELLRQSRRTWYLPPTLERLEALLDDMIERVRKL